MRYPNTLRAHREARQLRQWDVARDTDIPLSRYNVVENGRTRPSFAEAMRLGAYFGVAPDVLFPLTAEQAA